MPFDESGSYFGQDSSVLTRFGNGRIPFRDPGALDRRFHQRKLAVRSALTLFNTRPLAAKANGAGACTGTAGDTNIMMFPWGNSFEYHIKGTQTIVCPVIGTLGLNVAMDQTANDGVEITMGITALSARAFVVGTDAAFYARLKFNIADVTGTDDCAFGFRKAEAYQANVDDYDEAAFLNVISGLIKIETILNNGATTTTDTTNTWADTVTKTLEVWVSAAGVVTYKIDGVAPTVTAAFTFDAGEVVVPFFYFLQDTDLCDTLELIEFEVGLQ